MKRIIYKTLAFSLIFSLASCGNAEKENSIQEVSDDRIKISKEQFNQNKMTLGSMEERPFPVAVTVNGMIDVPPENRAVVSSIMGGYIKNTPLLIGDVVKKGQALATIENPEFVSLQQEYMEVKEQLNYLKSEYNRQRTMLEENITSQKNYLKAESTYKTAQAKYNGLKKQLRMLNISPSSVENGNITSIISIYAPISGSITKVNVSKGTYVSPSTSIVEIVNNDHIHLELSVFEKDIMKVKKGQKIIFKIPESSNESYEAEVLLVGTAIEDNRTIKVHGHPLNKSNRFLTGMFINADIITDESSSKAIPAAAVVDIEETQYILVLDEESDTDYYFNQVEVAVGNTANGYTEIAHGNSFTETDKFLVTGAFSLIGVE